MKKASIAALILALAPALAVAEPVTYKVDADHSGVSFSIRHFVSNTPGRFKDFDGTIKYDKDAPAASSVEFTIQAASIDTANNDRDEHLRGADFFDVQKFPTLTFVSNSVKPVDKDTLEVTGDMTMHGVTKKITIPVEVLGAVKTPNGEKAGFETTFTVNRKDFGIVWNRMLDTDTVLGEDVKITVNIEANGPKPAPAK